MWGELDVGQDGDFGIRVGFGFWIWIVGFMNGDEGCGGSLLKGEVVRGEGDSVGRRRWARSGSTREISVVAEGLPMKGEDC